MNGGGGALEGRVAVVSGGTSGIGLGMARALAAAGASVALWGRDAARNARAEVELRDGGAEVMALRCDVGDEAEVDAAVAETLSRWGRIDAGFVNAGVPAAAHHLWETPTEEWRRVLRVNLDGAFFTMRSVARHMVERGGGGSLVVTSSLAATEGQAQRYPYAASKGALLALVRAAAVELARHRIRVNAVLPGWIQTPMTADHLEGDSPAARRMEERVLPRVPLRRWGEAADFGGIAVYLAGDASAYHTGDVITIDGGYSVF